MNDFKICTKCNIEKDIKYFEFRSDTNKYRNYCKKCNKGYLTTRDEKLNIINTLFLEGLKECSKCKEIKILDEFNNDKVTITGKTSYCKKCISEKYTKDEIKNNSYKTKYNISLEDYNKMLINQNNKCDICKIEFNNLVVDHCHTTGKVRGLLCNGCNSGIGFFKENKVTILNSIEYLNKHEK